MKKIFISFFIFMFTLHVSYANSCIDSLIISEIEVSLNSNSFTQDYDGTSGIIEKITYSNGKYDLWQTPLLPKVTSANYEFSNTWNPSISFVTSQNYDENSLLEIPISSNSFLVYLKVTSRFIGDCSSTYGEIKINDALIDYYGSTSSGSKKAISYKSPQSFVISQSVTPGDEFTQIFQLSDSNILFDGRLNILIGPRNHQKLNIFFKLQGNKSICGDSKIGYNTPYSRQEVCDIGIDANCDTSCNFKNSVCGNGIVEQSRNSFMPGEVCDIASNPQCNSCTSITSICGNGIVESSGNNFVPGEVCDTASNPQCNSCTSITPVCGNGIVENNNYHTIKEECDDGNTNDGDSCSSTCSLEVVDPVVTWTNYLLAEDMFLGNNLTPGASITYTFNISNPNSQPLNITMKHRFTTEHWSKAVSNKIYHYFETRINPWQKQHPFEEINFIISPNSNMSVSNTLTIPASLSQAEIDSVYSILIEEFIEYSTLSSSLPPTSIFATNGIYGVGSEKNRRNVDPNRNKKKYLGFHGNIGSFYPMYLLTRLTPDSTTFLQTTNEDGIPSIQVNFEGGEAYSNWQNIIPNDSFYLYTELQMLNNSIWETMYKKNYSINEFVNNNPSWPIHQVEFNQRGVYRLDNGSTSPYYEQRVSFPVIDFETLNEKKVKILAIPYNKRTNTPIYSFNIHETNEQLFNLNSIFLSVDRPINIYPNGPRGFNEISTRLVLFNEKDFSLFDVNINVSIVGSTGDFDISDLTFTYPKNIKVPAESAFPIPIKITYNGQIPNNILTDQLLIKLSFIDPSDGSLIERETYIQLIVNPNMISNSFVDLIVEDLDFTLLNINEVSTLNFTIKNQGTLASGSFDVDIYYKYENESNFNHLQTIPVSSLSSGEDKKYNLPFIPDSTQKVTIKVVMDERNEVYEDNTLVIGAKENNILTATASIRDLDVFLERVIIDYDNANNGIIPIKAYASNKGVGGIDSYEMKLTLTNDKKNYSESRYFIQIPQAGKEVIYYLNVSDKEPGSYKLRIDLIAPFDQDLSDNFFETVIDFCPTPWFNGPLSCNTYCTSTCLNPFTNRYLATCHSINGCFFKNPEFAAACDGFKEGSYAPIYDEFGNLNLTHEAQCHQGVKIVEKSLTDEDLSIDGDCREITIQKYPGIFNNLDILINVVECIEE